MGKTSIFSESSSSDDSKCEQAYVHLSGRRLLCINTIFSNSILLGCVNRSFYCDLAIWNFHFCVWFSILAKAIYHLTNYNSNLLPVIFYWLIEIIINFYEHVRRLGSELFKKIIKITNSRSSVNGCWNSFGKGKKSMLFSRSHLPPIVACCVCCVAEFIIINLSRDLYTSRGILRD